jgi:hypothetical protein
MKRAVAAFALACAVAGCRDAARTNGSTKIAPGDSKQDARERLRAIVDSRYTEVTEVAGEFRVLRRADDHIWACQVFLATVKPDAGIPPGSHSGRYRLLVTAHMRGDPDAGSVSGTSIAANPIASTSATPAGCDEKIASEFPDVETSLFDRLVP